MKRKPYPAYKSSGVEWLGEVPSHWAVKRLKYCLSLKTKKESQYGNQIALENIESWTGRLISTDSEFEGEGVSFKKGNILFGKLRPYLAKVYFTEYDGEAVGDFFVLQPNEISDGKYASFLIRTKNYIEVLDGSTYGAKMPRVSWEFMGNLSCLVPPLPEQQTITDFLDRETGKIDTLINKNQRLIELLKEKRMALISRAVTKGLDPTAKMKPSGVEWLGDVPEHWEVVRVKALEGNSAAVVQTGPFGAQLHAGDYIDEGVPLILIRNVGDMRIDDTNIPMISHEDAERLSMYRIKKGDIVFSRVGSIGRIAPCTEREDGWLISGQMLRLRITNPHLHGRFGVYAFGCSSLLTFVELQSVGSTRESINTEILRNMPLPLPPLPEQQVIADFLYKETGKIDALIAKVETVIEKLKEYRTALISAAVTGKIDVREAA